MRRERAVSEPTCLQIMTCGRAPSYTAGVKVYRCSELGWCQQGRHHLLHNLLDGVQRTVQD